MSINEDESLLFTASSKPLLAYSYEPLASSNVCSTATAAGASVSESETDDDEQLSSDQMDVVSAEHHVHRTDAWYVIFSVDHGVDNVNHPSNLPSKWRSMVIGYWTLDGQWYWYRTPYLTVQTHWKTTSNPNPNTKYPMSSSLIVVLDFHSLTTVPNFGFTMPNFYRNTRSYNSLHVQWVIS